MLQSRHLRPRCHPALPESELLEHPALTHLVLDLAIHLEVRSHFIDSNELEWSTARGRASPIPRGSRPRWPTSRQPISTEKLLALAVSLFLSELAVLLVVGFIIESDLFNVKTVLRHPCTIFNWIFYRLHTLLKTSLLFLFLYFYFFVVLIFW